MSEESDIPLLLLEEWTDLMEDLPAYIYLSPRFACKDLKSMVGTLDSIFQVFCIQGVC